MPDIYGVTPANVIAEIPELFPSGLSASTRPTEAQVATWITVADTVVWLRIYAVTGEMPAPSDASAVIARQYIIEWAKGKIKEAIYAGRADAEVKTVTDPHFDAAALLLESLVDLGEQATGGGTEVVEPFDPAGWTIVKSLRTPIATPTVTS